MALSILSLQLETVPYLIDNPEVGYVQARWIFANPDECYLTKVSHINLQILYHAGKEAEQSKFQDYLCSHST